MTPERKRTIFQLVFLWSLSIVLATSSLATSIYVFKRDRIDYSCEDNGHGFEPRYEYVPPSTEEVAKLNIFLAENQRKVIRDLTRRVYIQDVCQYCGKTSKRRGT